VSPNPLGRPRLTPEQLEASRLRAKALRAAKDAAAKAAREAELQRLDIILMSREHAHLAVAALSQIATSGDDDNARVRAADLLLSRGFGKLTETIFARVEGVNRDAMPLLAAATTDFRQAFRLPQIIEHEPAPA
jgi:hypothetical protein